MNDSNLPASNIVDIQTLFPPNKPRWISNTITYNFMPSLPSVHLSRGQNFQPLVESQKLAAEAALQLWADVANIKFERLPDVNEEADIRFGTNNQGNESYAYAFFPVSSTAETTEKTIAGDVFLNNSYEELGKINKPELISIPGSLGFSTLIHEIGHALGLKHPGNYDAGGGGSEPPYLTGAKDSTRYSIMTYTEPFDSVQVYSQMPMIYDIAAIQELYGVNLNTRSGDTSYSWSQRFLATIWDAGGNDTINAANWTNVSINLNEGEFSSIGLDNNLAIAFGVTIENAIGGAYSDTLIGNQFSNRLDGGDGNDEIFGGAGEDTLWGGDGNDILRGGDQNDILVGDRGNDILEGGFGDDSLDAGEGDDTLIDLEGNNTFYAGEGNNSVTAGSRNDVIYAGASNDLIDAGNGNNLIYAAEGNNLIGTGSGNDIVYAGSGSDWIFTGAGDDVIYAAEGDNLIAAGAGDNLIYSGSGRDLFALSSGAGSTTIDQFQSHDRLGLIGGLSYDQLSITLLQQGNEFSTQISITSTGDLLASLKWIEASSITRDSFVDAPSLGMSQPNGAASRSLLAGLMTSGVETGLSVPSVLNLQQQVIASGSRFI